MTEEVKVLRTWSSPFALRIIHALELKGIEYEAILEDLENKSPLLLNYNPVHKKVPVLVHNGKAISESLVILEYIDETWKKVPLLPEDPYEKSRARFWAKFGDEKLLPSILDASFKQGKDQEEAYIAALENLKLVEEQLKGKKFFGGERIGYLDLAFGWLANVVSVLEEVTGQSFINSEKFPLLSAWIRTFSDAPVIKEWWPPRDRLIGKFQGYRPS